MRKTLKIIGIYLFLIVVIQSCGKDHYAITDIEFSGARVHENNKDYFVPTNLLKKNEIVFMITPNIDYVASLDLGLSEKCYATSRGEVIDNVILENTYSLKFDHPFTYKNVTIDANQNLFEIDDIKKQIEIHEGKIFKFSQEFNSESIFTDGDYEVTFSCSTSDNRNFEKKIIVKIEN